MRFTNDLLKSDNVFGSKKDLNFSVHAQKKVGFSQRLQFSVVSKTIAGSVWPKVVILGGDKKYELLAGMA